MGRARQFRRRQLAAALPRGLGLRARDRPDAGSADVRARQAELPVRTSGAGAGNTRRRRGGLPWARPRGRLPYRGRARGGVQRRHQRRPGQGASALGPALRTLPREHPQRHRSARRRRAARPGAGGGWAGGQARANVELRRRHRSSRAAVSAAWPEPDSLAFGALARCHRPAHRPAASGGRLRYPRPVQAHRSVARPVRLAVAELAHRDQGNSHFRHRQQSAFSRSQAAAAAMAAVHR